MKKILMLIMLVSIMFLLVSCGDKEVETEEQQTDAGETLETTTMEIVSGDTAVVTISNSKFMPTDLEIKVGTVVTWNNADTEDHTVTFENGDVDEMLPNGASVSHTFEEVGQFGYFCQLHPGMRGLVIVTE